MTISDGSTAANGGGAAAARPEHLSRRAFVGGLGAVGIALVAGPALTVGRAAALGRPGPMPVSLAELDRVAYAGLVGHTFVVHDDKGHRANLTLAQVKDRGHIVTVRGRSKQALTGSESFSVTFSGRRDRPLTQGTYRFAHPRLGVSALFIVPMRAQGATQRYEAVFTRV